MQGQLLGDLAALPGRANVRVQEWANAARAPARRSEEEEEEDPSALSCLVVERGRRKERRSREEENKNRDLRL